MISTVALCLVLRALRKNTLHAGVTGMLDDTSRSCVCPQEGDFPWRWSFCGWTMASEQHSVMVINDAHLDARYAHISCVPTAERFGKCVLRAVFCLDWLV